MKKPLGGTSSMNCVFDLRATEVWWCDETNDVQMSKPQRFTAAVPQGFDPYIR